MTAGSAAVPLKSVASRSAASSVATRVILAVWAIGLFSAPARAQRAPATPARDSARDAAADSLAARLKRAEEAIALLQQQLGEQAASGVSTRSRMQLELTGRVVVNTFRNERRVNNADDPQFVRPDTTSVVPIGSLGMAIRQTSLGAVLNARDVLGGRFVGDVDVDFFGGQQPSSGGRTFPLVRLRTARGAVRWTHGEFMVGQESPLIAGVNPVSPAAMGTPGFVTAGNLWLWLPQVRATIEAGSSVRFALQAAVLANMNGDAAGAFDTDVDPAERSGVPATEGRVRVRWGEDDRASEIGCGGHLAYLAIAGGSSVQTYAGACDARVVLVPGLEVRGEGYIGRGLRGLGGGGVSQNLGRSGMPLDDRGGWAQLNLDVTSLLRVGGGCGADEPREADVLAGGRLRNQSCAGYAWLRPTGPMFVGAEVRQLTTRYATGSVTNNHLNLAVGFEF